MAETEPGTGKPYHHGNLRQALIEATLGLIEERGPLGFTLAEAARVAGVSAAAPYRHFRGRDELIEEVPREKTAVIFDYEADPGRNATVLEELAALPFQKLLDFEELTALLGYSRDANPLDLSVQPRGYRVLAQVPRLPDGVVRQVVRDFGSLDAIIRASHRDLEAVDGVGSVRAREIREGLRRLQEHNLVDRYLQL